MLHATGFLPTATLRDFFSGWTEVVATIDRVKAGSAGGQLIQYPKMPPSVSESLAARMLIRERVFEGATGMVRGGAADIRVSRGGETILVEVKGSGSAEFQTFGRRDYGCHMLVWLRFGEASQLTFASTVRATLFPRPAECLGQLGSRVTHGSAEATAAARGFPVRHIEVSLSALVE